LLTFSRNILPPSSGFEEKAKEKASMKQVEGAFMLDLPLAYSSEMVEVMYSS
jgi:hypothetical protein